MANISDAINAVNQVYNKPEKNNIEPEEPNVKSIQNTQGNEKMDPMTLAAIIYGIGTIISTGISEYQYEDSKDFQRENRNYYSESNTMARMMAAGISPAAAAQGISGGRGEEGVSTTPYNTDFSKIGDGIFSARKMEYDNQLAKANAEKAIEDTKWIPRMNIATEGEINSRKDLNYTQKLNLLNQNRRIRGELKKWQKENEYTDKEIEVQNKILKWYDQRNQTEIDAMNTQIYKWTKEAAVLDEEQKKDFWTNKFRDDFGFDPHDSVFSQCVQAAVNGKMTNIVDGIVKSFKDAATSSADNVGNIFSDSFKDINNWYNNFNNWSNRQFKGIGNFVNDSYFQYLQWKEKNGLIIPDRAEKWYNRNKWRGGSTQY